jgi:hypothetical protein
MAVCRVAGVLRPLGFWLPGLIAAPGGWGEGRDCLINPVPTIQVLNANERDFAVDLLIIKELTQEICPIRV